MACGKRPVNGDTLVQYGHRFETVPNYQLPRGSVNHISRQAFIVPRKKPDLNEYYTNICGPHNEVKYVFYNSLARSMIYCEEGPFNYSTSTFSVCIENFISNKLPQCFILVR